MCVCVCVGGGGGIKSCRPAAGDTRIAYHLLQTDDPMEGKREGRTVVRRRGGGGGGGGNIKSC